MSAYLAAVLADSPIHYWRCCDGGGQLLHDIGSASLVLFQSNNQTSAVGLGYSAANSDGGCVLCNGNQFFQHSVGVVKSAPLTIECLVFPVTTFGGGGWAIGTNRPLLGQTSTAQPNAVGLGGGSINGAAAMSLNRWHHLALVMTAGTVELFADGVSVATLTTGQPNNTSTWDVGSDGTNGYPGFVSEVAVYAAALSSARIAAHFAAIDQVANIPVFGASGGTGGAGSSSSSPAYLSILQQILQSVRQTF